MIHNTETATDSVDTGALVINGPQPVWMTLNDAREQAFTGEITFEDDPEVLAYLDNGVVYFAERAGDAPLGQRLLDAGVLDATQLERGMVRLGDLEHLGRLFDRDPSINRDAVVVTAELFTEELITDVANRTIASARVVAYRHHPSGVHRWFVAPIDQPVVARPIGAIGQLDGTVVDDLPGLPYGFEDEELMIEWDAMVDTDLDVDDLGEVDESEIKRGEMTEIITPEEFDADALELSLELAEFVDGADEQVDPPDFELVDIDFEDADIETTPFEVEYVEAAEFEDDDIDTVATETADVETVDAEAADGVVEPDVDDAGAGTDGDDFEFSVVWPDGSEQLADGTALDIDDPIDVEPTFTETDDGELQFSMPPLTLSDEPEAADAEVPDDVADAVRRAIAAIESASVGESDAGIDLEDAAPESPDTEFSHAEITDVGTTATDNPLEMPQAATAEPDLDGLGFDHAPMPEAPAAPANGLAGFAPPTMATRAEVLYGQMADDGAVIADPALAPTLAGQTPVMATSADATGGHGDERSSALRRLIGSLRRKDH